MPKRTLKFLVYSIHGHLPVGTPDYSRLSKALTELKGSYRRNGSRLTAIGASYLTRGGASDDRLALVIYSGDADKSVLYFDLNEQTEFSALMQSGRFVAKKTRVLIDPRSRIAVIEAGRSHPPAEEIAAFLEEKAQGLTGFEGLELSFVPIATTAFVKQIDQMQRIQSVTVSIARPNPDWGDRYDQLTRMADDSRAKAIDTTIRAGRNQGLSKDRGLIPSVKHWLTDTLPSIASAKIRGSMGDGSGIIELRLSDHVETLNVTTDVNPETGQPLDGPIEGRLNSFLDQRTHAQ